MNFIEMSLVIICSLCTISILHGIIKGNMGIRFLLSIVGLMICLVFFLRCRSHKRPLSKKGNDKSNYEKDVEKEEEN